MVFIGSWRPRRRGYGPYGSPGYGYRGYGGYPGSSCARDLCLVETGCCLAESMGCGPQLTLLAPGLVRRSLRAARLAGDDPGRAGQGWLLRLALSAVALYQSEISASRRAVCRFTPSCSHYAVEALQTHGLRRGLQLTTARLLRCRPGATGGADPVPGSPRTS